MQCNKAITLAILCLALCASYQFSSQVKDQILKGKSIKVALAPLPVEKEVEIETQTETSLDPHKAYVLVPKVIVKQTENI